MRVLPLPVLAFAGSLLPAQARPDATAAATPPPRVELDQWSEARGRQLFAACDQNADDGLDLLETCAAFELPVDAAARERFRRLDLDRDGFLGWTEFERYCAAALYDGRVLRLQLCRQEPAAAIADAGAPASPAERLLQLFDADHDGRLSLAEAARLLTEANLPALLMTQLTTFDRDRSGDLSAAELQPLLRMVPGIAALPAKATALALLPKPFASCDADGNGCLDARELAHCLRRIDPALAALAPQLLARLDRDRDQLASAAELEQPAAATAQGAGARAPHR